MKVLAIDPGTTNFATAVFECSDDTTTLFWEHTFDVGHEPKKIARACELLKEVCNLYDIKDVLVEYQYPAYGSRWNIYVESAIVTTMLCWKHNVITLQPSVVKRKLKLATGNYADNKRQAYNFARQRCPRITSHHLADCFLLAEYYRLFV